MPDLSKEKIISPIEKFNEPIYHRYGSTIGSADTGLGRLLGRNMGGYYDRSFAGYENQQNERYANQGIVNSIGNFAADLGVKTLSGVPGLIGGITGLVGGGVSAAMGGEFYDGFNHNPFLNLTESMNAWGDEYFPHMLEADYHDRTFAQQLFSSGGQILTSNVSTLGFLAQSFATAGLMSAVGIGARVAPALGKVQNFRKALTSLEATNLAKIASNIDDLALNTFLTTNEAAMEGMEAKKTAVEKLTQDRIDGKNNYTDDQIEEMASSSMNNVFWGNMASLGFTNYAFGKLVSPMFSPKAVATRANKWALNKATKADDLVSGPKKVSKFEKFLFDEGHATGMAVKSLTTQALTEGPEESIQMSIQNVNDVYEGKKDFLDSYQDALKDFALHGFDLSNEERLKAFGLGSIVGVGSSGVMMFSKYGAVGQAKQFRKDREEYEKSLNQAYTDFNSYSLVKKTEAQKGKVFTKDDNGTLRYFVQQGDKTSEVSEATYNQFVEQHSPDPNTGEFEIPGKIETDENGVPLKDMSKMADLAASAKYHAALDDMIDVEASKGKPDEIKLSLYKKQKINDLAKKAFVSGTTGILMEKLDEFKTISDERLQNEGYDSREQLESEVEGLKKYVERLEKNYLSTMNGLVVPPKIAASEDFMKFRNDASDLGSHIVSMDALIEEVYQKITDLYEANPNMRSRLGEIETAFKEGKVGELFPYTTSFQDEAVQSEYAQLLEKQKEITRIREEMGEAYSKFFDPEHGFKAWKKDRKSLFPKLDYRKKLIINDLTTEEDFDNYVNAETKFEQLKESDKRATSVFYSDALNKFVHFLVPEGFTADAAESLDKLVTDIIDKEVQLYPDEAEKLKGYIDQMRSAYLEALDTVNKKAEDMGVTMDYLMYDLMPEDLTPEESTLVEQYTELEEIGAKMSNLNNNADKLKEKIDALTGMNFELASDSEILGRVMTKLLKPFSTLIEVSGFNGETISDDFMDVARTQQAAATLETLINKALKPKADKNKIYKKYLKEAKEKLANIKKIETLAKENVSNREKREIKENNLYAEAFETVFDAFGISKTEFNTVKEISKPLAAMATPHIIKNTVQEPQIVLDGLKAKAFELINNLTAFNQARKSMNTAFLAPSEEEIKAAINNPTKAFGQIWKKLASIEQGLKVGENINPLKSFVIDYDLVSFSTSIKDFDGTTPVEELQDLLDTYLQLVAISQIESVVNSTYSDVDYLGNLIKTIGKIENGVIPSQSQMRVLRELVMFYNSPFNKRGELFDNVAALKAPAGAGKSLVVAKYFKTLAGLKDSEVITAAPLALAAENIATSMNSTHGANTVVDLVDKLNNDTLPKNVRLLLIDEAGALSTDVLNSLSTAIAKYNSRNPNDVVRAIMLYDPNQISTGGTGVASVESLFFHEFPLTTEAYWSGDEVEKRAFKTGQRKSTGRGLGPNMVHNITQITPLSTTYRTDVVEIADLQNKFKSTDLVTSLDSSASSNPLSNTDGIMGTFAEKGSNIVDVFNKSQRANPDRSRSVIVGSESKRQQYQKDLPGAEILTAEEAQGITRDEVYVDVTPGDSSRFDNNPRVFNQFMYTATSRAVKYLHVANAPTPTFVEDKTIPDRVKELADKKENLKQATLDRLTAEQKALKEILNEEEKVVPNEEELAKPEEEVVTNDEEEVGGITDEGQDEWDGDVGGDAPIDLPITEGFHSLRRPNSKVFEDDGIFTPLAEGTPLELVKDVSNNKLRYAVLQKSIDGKGRRIVAILEENELDDLRSSLGVDPSTLTGHVLRKDLTYGNDAVTADEDVLDSINVYSGGSSADIRYVYQPNVTYSFKDVVDDEGVVTSLPILERHLKSMFGPNPGDYIEDYEDVLENFQKYTKIIAYSNDKQILLDFGQGKKIEELDLSKTPRKNVPYLVIENIKLKKKVAPGEEGKAGNETRPMAKQFIRLQTEVIDSRDSFMEPIYSFLSKLERFEKLLGGLTNSLPGKYPFLRNGVGIQTDQLNTYYAFHAFVAELSNAYKKKLKGEDYTVDITDEKYPMEMFPPIEASKIPAELLELAYELDVAVHGELEEKEKRAYNGPAQQAMDSIGAQNLVVSTANGTNVLLRDYRTVGYSKERGEATEAAGISLLGPLKFATKGRSYNSLIKSKLRVRLQAYYDRLVKRGKHETPRGNFIKGLLDSPQSSAHLTPATTGTLMDLFKGSIDPATQKLSLVSNGFGLRRPLKKDLTPKINYGVLEHNSIDSVDASYLTSTFDKVIPTSITITANKNAKDVASPIVLEEKIPDSPIITLKRQIESNQPITADEETKEDFVRLMGAQSFDEAVETYKSRMSEDATFTFGVETIHGAMREFYKGTPGRSLEESILSEIDLSMRAIGVGRQEGKTAARDYIRATVLARMFPGLSYRQSKTIVDLARDHYDVAKQKDIDAFGRVMETLMLSTRSTPEQVMKNLKAVGKVYAKILKEAGIKHNFDYSSYLTGVQSIVMASSKYRESIRSKQTPPIVVAKQTVTQVVDTAEGPVVTEVTVAPDPDAVAASTPPLNPPGYEKFLRELVEASQESEDAYIDIFNDPANREFINKLGKDVTEDNAFEKAAEALADIENERSFLYTEDSEIGDLMTDQQVSELLDKLYPPKYTKFIDWLIGSKKQTAARRFAVFNILQNSKGQKVWGLYKDGVMSFMRHSSGKIGKKVVLHEYFHKVFWEFLTHGERVHLFALAQEKWGNLTTEQLEEKMADDFMDFVPKPKASVFSRFWEFLRRLLGFSRSYMSSLEDYYNGIYQRKFSDNGRSVEVERSFSNILTKYDTLEQYFLAKEVLMSTYADILSDRKRSGKVLSLEEAANETFNALRIMRDNPAIFTDNEASATALQEALDKTLQPKTEFTWRNDLFAQTATRKAAEAAFNEQKKADLEKAQEYMEYVKSLMDGDQDDSTIREAIEKAIQDAEGAESLEDVYNLAQDEADGINAERFDSELRDPKIKLTGSVKQRLLSIRYVKNGKLTFGELDRTYSIIMGKLASLPTTSLEETVSIIRNSFSRYMVPVEKPNIEQATGKFMFDTASRLGNALAADSNIRKDISFRKDVTSSGLYVIISNDGSPTHSVTKYQAQESKGKYTVIEQEIGTTTDVFINLVTSSLPNTKKEQVADAYFFFEDIDFMRSLISAVSSLRKSNPHVALQWWDYGKYKTAFYQIKMSGGATAFQGRVITALTEITDTLTGDQLFPIELMAKFVGADNRAKKLDALTDLVTYLNLPFKKKVLESVSDEVLNRHFGKFIHALESMSNKFAKSSDDFSSEEEWNLERSGAELLKEETAFLSGLAEILNSHYGLVDNNSYTRGDGKKAYGYVDESYQSSLLASIQRAAAGLAHKVFDTFSLDKNSGKLTSNDRFLKDNIFITGKNRIKGYIDYDSRKTKGNAKFAKYLRKEGLADFRERHFTFGFLTRLRQSKGNSYYQFLPIPSNRTAIQAVEVRAFNTEKEIDDALLSIIRAQKNRPDPKDHPDLAANKTYTGKTKVTYKKWGGTEVTEDVPNYKLWKIAGIEGNVDSFTEKQALARIKEHVGNKVNEMLPDMMYKEFGKKNTMNISDRDLNYALSYFGFSKKDLIDTTVSGRSEDDEKATAIDLKNKAIKKVLPFFYYNFIINQYAASQIVYGDESFYKHKEDQTKRIQIVTATGDTLVSDGKYGMPKRTKVMVISDIKMEVPNEIEGAERDVYDSTDAEGFVLPEYYERIALTYGTEAMVDVVLKPVYFSVVNGVPTAVKYSAKVLTDELVEKYPHLGILRQAMRDNGADQAVFASAVKVGMPKDIAKMSQEGVLDLSTVNKDNFLDLDSNLLRFQLNPAKSPDITTRNPSQITSFVNTNGLNQQEVYELHRLNARIIENGRRKISRLLRLTAKGTLTNKSIRELTNLLKKNTEGLAGALDLHRLVSYRSKDGKNVTLDLPLIADRAVATLAAMVSDETVGFRFQGSKLVLQADIGKHKVFGEKEPRELKWRDDEGYAEVILPESYKKYIKEGEMFIPGLENGLVGFRIPSTNYHSAVPMKVVGFYPVPKGGTAKGNLIIAPSLIVYYHGSDKHHCRNKTSLIAGNSLESRLLRVTISRIGQSAAKPHEAEGSTTSFYSVDPSGSKREALDKSEDIV